MRQEYKLIRQKIELNHERDIYQAYMPFVKNGALFIRTAEKYELGTEIVLEVSLPDSLESSIIKGEVCWLTPKGAQNGTPEGVGVGFIEDKDNVKRQIETQISRLLNSSDPTFTM